MSKTISLPYKGGRRRIELVYPGEKTHMHYAVNSPRPLRLDADSFEWIQEMAQTGSELEKSQIESMHWHEGLKLVGEIIDYWNKSGEDDDDDFSGLDLNDDGSVDLEDNR